MIYDPNILDHELAKLVPAIARSKAKFIASFGVEPNVVVVHENYAPRSKGICLLMGLTVIFTKDVMRPHVGLFESKRD